MPYNFLEKLSLFSNYIHKPHFFFFFFFSLLMDKQFLPAGNFSSLSPVNQEVIKVNFAEFLGSVMPQ